MGAIDKLIRTWFGKALFNLIKDYFQLFLAELRLAGLSLLPLGILSVIFLIPLASLWLLILILIGYGAWHYGLNIFLSLVVAMSVNIVVMVIMGFYIYRLMGNLRFRHTREIISVHKTQRISYGKKKRLTKRN